MSAAAANSVIAGSVNAGARAVFSRYESQKRRDWNTFGQYLKNHKPPLQLSRCSGAHILEFLRHLDQFGKTRVHNNSCPFFGHPQPPVHCPCPLRQAWGSLDALVGRLRAAFEENGGTPEINPFGARAVRLYLREVRDTQARARGIGYEKKKRRKPPQKQAAGLRRRLVASTSSASAMSSMSRDQFDCSENNEDDGEEKNKYNQGGAGGGGGGGGGGVVMMTTMMAGTSNSSSSTSSSSPSSSPRNIINISKSSHHHHHHPTFIRH